MRLSICLFNKWTTYFCRNINNLKNKFYEIIALLLVVVVAMSSCSSLKSTDTSTLTNAATLLGSLSSNSTVQQISTLFSLLDANWTCK